jgi:hypothetical protein
MRVCTAASDRAATAAMQSGSTMPIGTPGRVTIACGSMASGLMCRTRLSWMDRTAPATQWFGLTTWMVIRKRAVSCLEAWAEFGGRRVYKGHLPAEDVRYRKADIGRRREATQPLRVAIFALGRDVIWRCARPAFGARTLTAFGSPERKSVIQGWLHPNAISAFRQLFSWA